MESGHIKRLPIDTTARIAYAMLGAAGQALSHASEEEKPSVREEYRLVIGQLLAGLASESQ
jgi:hypothetical protein